jgi:ferrous iron transport protein B
MDGATLHLNVALLGNPNCGKTALFNLLTGSRQKVANYAGVTVERKEGLMRSPSGRLVRVLDLPGAYSLNPLSVDEAITRDVVTGIRSDVARPELLVCVTDATNLKLNLRLVLEARRLGVPIVVALNMSDLAKRRGITIDRAALERELGMPVVETIGIHHEGAKALVAHLDAYLHEPDGSPSTWEAPTLDDVIATQRQVRRILQAAVHEPQLDTRLDDAIDRVVLHPAWGLPILAVLLFLMFQAVFSWAQWPMDAIKQGMQAVGTLLHGAMPAGVLRSLVVDGVIAGAGSVLVFLP